MPALHYSVKYKRQHKTKFVRTLLVTGLVVILPGCVHERPTPWIAQLSKHLKCGMKVSEAKDLSTVPVQRLNEVKNRNVYVLQDSSFWNSTTLLLFFDGDYLRETQFGLAEMWSTKVNYQPRNDLCTGDSKRLAHLW